MKVMAPMELMEVMQVRKRRFAHCTLRSGIDL
jgi:hypothetical protein